MISQKRSFSILPTLLKSKPTSSNDLKPVFKQPHHLNSNKGQPQPQNFEKNLPQPKIELKPWEKQNISKDSFFKRKYGNISPQDRKALNEKVERQRRFRAMKIAHEKSLQEKAYQERERARELAREAKGKGKNFKSGGSSNYDTGVMVDRNDTIFDYVFGTHPVKAVLMAGKRRILDLYTFNNEDPDIVKLAMEKYGIVPKRLKDKNALNILCKNGVHNGVVLKTNKLDIPYIKEVGHAENGEYKLAIEELDDAAAVDDDGEVKVKTKKVIRDDDIEQIEELYPLSLYLDEITDPQNMGSILRSAYFFGVDFIVVPNHSTAKLGPVANKASAGVLDLIDIYQTGSSLKFIDSVRQNGWHVISTSGRPTGGTKSKEITHVENDAENDADVDADVDVDQPHLKNKFIELQDLRTILKKTPVMLIIGSEGSGVRTNMKIRSDYLVGIPKIRRNDNIVDSLNAGVATGVILQNCLD